MAMPRRLRRALYVLGIPTVVMAGAFSYAADNHFAAGAVGAVVGCVIGFAVLAFPNLDRGGPEDSDDFLH